MVTQPLSSDMAGNGLLSSIEPRSALLKLRPLESGARLWSQGDLLDQVWFPLSGGLAQYSMDSEGRVTQVACVEREGAAGLFEVLARAPALADCRVLSPGSAVVVPAATIQDWSAAEDHRQVFWREAYRVLALYQRSIVCASRHQGVQRLADWLLAHCRDAPDGRLLVNQETLAMALGVTRTTLTAYAGDFMDQGLVRAGRGWMALRDAERLRRIACGCRSHQTVSA